MRPHDRWKEKEVKLRELRALYKGSGIEISVPSQFFWPFPLWPLNRTCPFSTNNKRIGDVPVC